MSPQPIRLLDHPDLSAEERALLEFGQRDLGPSFDVEAGAKRLRAALDAAQTGASSPTRAGRGARLLRLGKHLGIRLLVGLAVPIGIYVALSRDSGPTAAPPRSAASMQVEKSAASPLEAAVPQIATHVQPQVPAPVTRRPKPRKLRSAPVPAHTLAVVQTPPSAANADRMETAESSAAVELAAVERAQPAAEVAEAEREQPARVVSVPEDDRAMAEVRALARARELVRRDPRGAVATLDQIGREFPHGFFVEERRALRILALVGAGQVAAAREQAAMFARDYPNGTFTDRVRSATDLP